jgi:hypothetical protein
MLYWRLTASFFINYFQTILTNIRSNSMSDKSMPWDEEALQRIEKIPSFVRGMAKAKIEKAAKQAGEEKVTANFLDANKAKLMG